MFQRVHRQRAEPQPARVHGARPERQQRQRRAVPVPFPRRARGEWQPALPRRRTRRPGRRPWRRDAGRRSRQRQQRGRLRWQLSAAQAPAQNARARTAGQRTDGGRAVGRRGNGQEPGGPVGRGGQRRRPRLWHRPERRGRREACVRRGRVGRRDGRRGKKRVQSVKSNADFPGRSRYFYGAETFDGTCALQSGQRRVLPPQIGRSER